MRVLRTVGDRWGSWTNVSDDTVIEFGLVILFLPEQATVIVTSMSNNNTLDSRSVVNRRVASDTAVLCCLNTIESVVQRLSPVSYIAKSIKCG